VQFGEHGFCGRGGGGTGDPTCMLSALGGGRGSLELISFRAQRRVWCAREQWFA
jgi:hypothetical protein